MRSRVGILAVTVPVNASVRDAWAATTDWEWQGTWMLGTRVRATANEGRGVGGAIEAWTGIGPIGFLDTMVITAWDPPYRCEVRHTGRVVRGGGCFEVAPGPDGTSLVTWSETLDLPGGPLGPLGWRIVRPLARFGLARSLARFSAAVSV